MNLLSASYSQHLFQAVNGFWLWPASWSLNTKKTLATKSFFKDFGNKVFFVAKITLPIEAEFSSCFAAILFCCEAPETLCGLKKHSPVSPAPIKPKVNTNKKLFYSLSILLLHRLFNISMSPCCKYCPDGGQPLLMLKKKKERWSFNSHADFFMAGLCTVQACLLRRLKLFSPREGCNLLQFRGRTFQLKSFHQ